MCILSVYRCNVPVDVEELRRGAQSNPDGHGYAIVINGEIVVGHSLDDPDGLIAEFAALRAEHPHGDAIFHSRITTHGGTALDNCHPFFVSGDTRTVLAHNGILPERVQPTPGDRRSDTRILAEDVFMNNWGRLDKSKTRKAFSNWIGTYNKVVILTVDPQYKHNLYLFNEKAGVTTDAGVWHSNSSFRTGRGTCGYTTAWSWTSRSGIGYTPGGLRHRSDDGDWLWDEDNKAWEYVAKSDDDESRYVAWWEDAQSAGTTPVVGLSGRYMRAICPSCRLTDTIMKVDLSCSHCYQCFVCYEYIVDCPCSYRLTTAVRTRLAALDANTGLSIEQTIKVRAAIREYADDMAYEEYCERHPEAADDVASGDALDTATFAAAALAIREAIRETAALPAAPVRDESRREAA